ncbi:MAG: DUF1574 family protein [Leptospira sp.]|nr:DUF1574 family protein [Leptospira sp.]
MNRYFFYPILLVLGIIAIDKLVCIPDVRESGRRSYKAGQNVFLGLPYVWKEDIQIQKQNKSIAMVVGTSRSDIFHQWETIPFSKSTFPKEIYFETRTAVKASEFLTFYIMIKSMTESGFRPDVIFLEFSEEMLNEFNSFSYKTKWQELTFHESELLDFYPMIVGKTKRDLIAKLLFLSYNYHISPIQTISNLITGKRVQNDDYFIQLTASLNKKRPYSKDDIGFEDGKIPEDIYKDRIEGYTNGQIEILLRNFTLSETEVNFFAKTLELSETYNIPLVIWEPQIHPYFQSKRKEITGGKLFRTYTQKFVSPESKNIRTVSLNEGNTNCKTYTDSSHVSPICVPEIAEKLIETAKTIPNFKINK